PDAKKGERLVLLTDAPTATVATMRKLLTILNAIIRDGRPWQNA
ncbi:IS110 family transposase, partial [Rhizobium ruizarguesonis]